MLFTLIIASSHHTRDSTRDSTRDPGRFVRTYAQKPPAITSRIFHTSHLSSSSSSHHGSYQANSSQAFRRRNQNSSQGPCWKEGRKEGSRNEEAPLASRNGCGKRASCGIVLCACLVSTNMHLFSLHSSFSLSCSFERFVAIKSRRIFCLPRLPFNVSFAR